MSFYFSQFYGICTIVLSVSQMRKLRLREMNSFTRTHTVFNGRAVICTKLYLRGSLVQRLLDEKPKNQILALIVWGNHLTLLNFSFSSVKCWTLFSQLLVVVVRISGWELMVIEKLSIGGPRFTGLIKVLDGIIVNFIFLKFSSELSVFSTKSIFFFHKQTKNGVY